MNFEAYRAAYKPVLPFLLESPCSLKVLKAKQQINPTIQQIFPRLKDDLQAFTFTAGQGESSKRCAPLRVGCVLSGGQAPGGHNVIAGIFDGLKAIHPDSCLFGFLNGPHGIYTNEYKELDSGLVDRYRNKGGFDMICSGRHKIETPVQFESSMKICQDLKLDGLVVIGGDDSNTNAGLLAEYFLAHGCRTRVIGCPKTIDGDLKNEFVEVSFGFDTACKTYSQCIGNIMFDCFSSKKYYHFIRLMGRSASHIALQCALTTRPNCVLIGEEIERNKSTLKQIVDELATIIQERHKKGKNYGVVLVPEGLIEFIAQVKVLITQINHILSATQQEKGSIFDRVAAGLTKESSELLYILPKEIANQLLLDRDPHGNVQVAKIETERLLVQMLQDRFKGSPFFTPQTHYFGYEGRCAFPTNFDCDYCYGLGYNAAILISHEGTGLMSCIRNLHAEPRDWQACGYPLVSMMDLEVRKGKKTPVITKALVDLSGPLFKYWQAQKQTWSMQDHFCCPGPVQFEGDCCSSKPYLAVPPKDVYIRPLRQQELPDTFVRLSLRNNHSHLSYARTTQVLQIKDLSNYAVVATDELPFKTALIEIACGHKYSKLASSSTKILDLQHQFEPKPRQGPEPEPEQALRVGVCFNARQLPGCHNLIEGLCELGFRVFGFLGGTEGLFNNRAIEITAEKLEFFRNVGGMHMLGRDKDKLRDAEELGRATATVDALELDGLVLVGATHTLTDVLILSEHLLKQDKKTRVVGVPCSIDQSVCHPLLELNLGFTTNTHFNATMVANLLTDASSNTKYWYFIRLMGKEMSFSMIEVALKTKPNLLLIGEEIFSRKALGINEVVKEIANLVEERARQGHNFGSVLLSDGLLSWIMEFIRIFREIDDIVGEDYAMPQEKLVERMTPWTKEHYTSLPDFTRAQLRLKRETNGSPQYSKIETERLFAHLVGKELSIRKQKGSYKGSYAPICHYFGYQGRSSLPCDFDAKLGKSYGALAGKIIEAGHTGYCASVRGLLNEAARWHMCGIPLLNMLDIKEHSSYGYGELVIQPSQLRLNSRSFTRLRSLREEWRLKDCYTNPGPIQFRGEMAGFLPELLALEFAEESEAFREIERQMTEIRTICKTVGDLGLLEIAKHSLGSLTESLRIIRNRLQQ